MTDAHHRHPISGHPQAFDIVGFAALELHPLSDYQGAMAWFYAPFNGNKPASTVVNGHRVVVVSLAPDRLAEGLKMFGADRIRRLKAGDSENERLVALQKFSKRARGSVVVAPPEAGMGEVMLNLQSELPWLQ